MEFTEFERFDWMIFGTAPKRTSRRIESLVGTLFQLAIIGA